MTRTPARRPRPGTLAWALTVDLVTLDPDDRAWHLAALDLPWMAGREVTVRLGNLAPCPRLVGFLDDALAAGVSVRLDGTPAAVRAWWCSLCGDFGDRPAAPFRPRHLRILPAPTEDGDS